MTIDELYKLAKQSKREKIRVTKSDVINLCEKLAKAENAIIDLKAALRTCQNVSNGVMNQYKDL